MLKYLFRSWNSGNIFFVYLLVAGWAEKGLKNSLYAPQSMQFSNIYIYGTCLHIIRIELNFDFLFAGHSGVWIFLRS